MTRSSRRARAEEDSLGPLRRPLVVSLRVIDYPAGAGGARAGAHRDYGVLTIIRSDAGGLEVQTRSGEWVPVQAPPGGYVVNIGDLMQRWTDDRWVSTLHRVVGDERRRRAGSRSSSSTTRGATPSSRRSAAAALRGGHRRRLHARPRGRSRSLAHGDRVRRGGVCLPRLAARPPEHDGASSPFRRRCRRSPRACRPSASVTSVTTLGS